MIDRRRLLITAAGVALLTPLCATAQMPSAPLGEADTKLDALLTEWFYQNLEDSPQNATNLGLDRGERAHLAGKLRDLGPEANARNRQQARDRWETLRSYDETGLSDAARLSLAVARFTTESAARGAAFDFGQGGPIPYVVSQRSGSYFTVPDFMANQHRLETTDDAQAFLSRLSAFARNVDQETAGIEGDAVRGVMLPSFLMDKVLTQLKTLADTPPGDMAMVQALIRKTAGKGLAGDWGTDAAGILDAEVEPALRRQIALFERLRPTATDEAGAWKLPDGAAYYAYALKANTTTDYTGEQIHQIGLEQVAAIQAEIDTILKGLGMSDGSVGARIKVLNEDPRYLWPNTDAGKVDLVASLNEQVVETMALLPRVFNTLPKAAVDVRRVPPSIEIGAPGGYYQGAPLDGSRPGAYYINLRDSGNWPKWGLRTLTYHEAVPGHHLQISIAREAGSLPIYRRTAGFSAYSEGWALYAERVAADDLDVYGADPLGRIGYLQSYLFRAVRLVVDTGLHHKKWSRQEAIDYMVAEAGEPTDSAQQEIDRYCVSIGQANAYKLGQTVIEGLRKTAEAKGGFDIKAFHDAVLLNGALPLSVLEAQFA